MCLYAVHVRGGPVRRRLGGCRRRGIIVYALRTPRTINGACSSGFLRAFVGYAVFERVYSCRV